MKTKKKRPVSGAFLSGVSMNTALRCGKAIGGMPAVALGLMLSCLPAMLGAQRATATTDVLRKRMFVSATLPGVCLGAPPANDTMQVRLTPGAWQEAPVRWWPDTLEVLVVREADEVRGGVHFPLFQVVRIISAVPDTLGRFATLVPDGEYISALTPAKSLCSKPGIVMTGLLERSVRVVRKNAGEYK